MYSVVSAVADHSTWSEHLLYDPELHRFRMRGSQNVIPSTLTSCARTYGRRLLSLSTTNRDDAVSTSPRCRVGRSAPLAACVRTHILHHICAVPPVVAVIPKGRHDGRLIEAGFRSGTTRTDVYSIRAEYDRPSMPFSSDFCSSSLTPEPT